MRGDEKDVTTVWLTLGQRTLRYETYVMPAPEENAGGAHTSCCCGATTQMVGAHFSIGAEDAVYLRGELWTSPSTTTSSTACAGHPLRDGRASASGP
jgi:hypothetical protein